MRVWFNGRTEAFQASNAGSIPVTRSTKAPGQSLIGSGLFVCDDNSGDKLVTNLAQRAIDTLFTVHYVLAP